jgi:hypothetical protein
VTDPLVGLSLRHAQRRSRTRVTWPLLLLLGATAVIAWRFVRQLHEGEVYLSRTHASASAPANHAEPGGDNVASTRLDQGVNRPVYPYSVIPGGVRSLAELKRDMEKDAVVARQYRSFDFQRAHLLQVSEKQAMYVSYRVGQKIYWTRRTVSLHPGETLISDGKMVVRARCGNRVAKAPLDAGSPLEPPQEDFDQPYGAMIAVPTALPVLATSPSSLPAPITKKKKKWWVLPLFAAPLGGLDPASSSHQPLAVTPEPGMTLLLLSGSGAAYWRVRKYRRKS